MPFDEEEKAKGECKCGLFTWVQSHWTNKLDSNVVRDSLGKEVAEEQERSLSSKKIVGFGGINFAYLISLRMYIMY